MLSSILFIACGVLWLIKWIIYIDRKDKIHFWIGIIGIILSALFVGSSIFYVYQEYKSKDNSTTETSSEIEYYDYEIIESNQTILMVDGETLDSSLDVTVINKDTNVVYKLNMPEDAELHFAFRATQEQFEKEFGDYIVSEKEGE